MSTFSEEEVATLAKGGNSAHNAVFMGEMEFGDRDGLSDPHVAEKMRSFIKSKYSDERWKAGSSGGGKWQGSHGLVQP